MFRVVQMPYKWCVIIVYIFLYNILINDYPHNIHTKRLLIP